MRIYLENNLMSQKQSKPLESPQQQLTWAAVDELVTRRCFELETKLRDNLLLLINPYSKKCRDVMDQHDLLMAVTDRIHVQLEKFESQSKIITILQRRQAEQSSSIEALSRGIQDLFENVQEMIRQQRARVDHLSVEANGHKQEIGRLYVRAESAQAALNKAYSDIFEHKHELAEHMQRVQYEWIEEQQRLVKMMHELRDSRAGEQRENVRTKDALQEFDTKLAEYRRELEQRMEKFDPMEFNLIEREWFEGEKVEMLRTMRDRCRQMERRVRDIERYVGYLEAISQDTVTMQSYLDVQLEGNQTSEFAVAPDTSRTVQTQIEQLQ